jgi:hypothetical protein
MESKAYMARFKWSRLCKKTGGAVGPGQLPTPFRSWIGRGLVAVVELGGGEAVLGSRKSGFRACRVGPEAEGSGERMTGAGARARRR